MVGGRAGLIHMYQEERSTMAVEAEELTKRRQGLDAMTGKSKTRAANS